MTQLFLVRDVAVPASLLARPDHFGGVRRDGLLSGDLLVQDGRVLGFTATPPREARVLSGGGRLVLPALAEPHLHLDKAFTLGRLSGIGRDLLSAIRAQEADKANWTDEDLRHRASRAMEELYAAGVGLARSHVDWGDGEDPAATPRAWDVLAEVAQEWRGRVTLQLSCLPEIDLFAEPETGQRIAEAVRRRDGVLGAWCLGHPRRHAGFTEVFRLADRYGLHLDFHVDEGAGVELDGLEIIARERARTGFEGPVLCGHAVSLMDAAPDRLSNLLESMARGGIALCALPTTNLFLQSRGSGTPDRRGITRLVEASQAGVATCLGTDNVQDAFYPLGRHDPLGTLALAVPALHLAAPLGDHLPLVSTQAAQAMGAAPVFVDRAPAAALLLAEARDVAGLLSCQPRRKRLPEFIATAGR